MGSRAGAAVAAVLIGCMVPVPGVATAARGPAVPYDFNGDGYVDLAIGVPAENVGRRVDAGVVHEIRGSRAGPTTVGDRVWHQNRRGVRDRAERGDRFGAALASGDFDADGYADLAIGVPGESLRGRRAGAVQVLYGSRTGLGPAGDQLWHQNRAGIPGSNQSGDGFGAALAAGDFDADGFADLAIGVPGEDVGGTRDAGRVVVLSGSARGLTGSGAQRWDEGVPGVAGAPGPGDRFGVVLAAGDVNADGAADLTIGTGVSRTATWLRRGIHVLTGGAHGLGTVGSQFLIDAPELSQDCVEQDCDLPFGDIVLADFNGDGRADLGHGLIPDGVVVRFSQPDGFRSGPAEPESMTPGHDQSWGISPDDGLMAEGGPADLVGASLAAGDLTGDRVADLAIGAPGYDSDGRGIGVGAVFVVPGSTEQMPWSVGIRAAGEVAGDRMGAALAILPLGGHDRGWLAIGTPGDEVSGQVHAGSVLLCPGDTSAYEGTCRAWHQDTPGVRGTAERWDGFGAVLGR